MEAIERPFECWPAVRTDDGRCPGTIAAATWLLCGKMAPVVSTVKSICNAKPALEVRPNRWARLCRRRVCCAVGSLGSQRDHADRVRAKLSETNVSWRRRKTVCPSARFRRGGTQIETAFHLRAIWCNCQRRRTTRRDVVVAGES